MLGLVVVGLAVVGAGVAWAATARPTSRPPEPQRGPAAVQPVVQDAVREERVKEEAQQKRREPPTKDAGKAAPERQAKPVPPDKVLADVMNIAGGGLKLAQNVAGVVKLFGGAGAGGGVAGGGAGAGTGLAAGTTVASAVATTVVVIAPVVLIAITSAIERAQQAAKSFLRMVTEDFRSGVARDRTTLGGGIMEPGTEAARALVQYENRLVQRVLRAHNVPFTGRAVYDRHMEVHWYGSGGNWRTLPELDVLEPELVERVTHKDQLDRDTWRRVQLAARAEALAYLDMRGRIGAAMERAWAGTGPGFDTGMTEEDRQEAMRIPMAGGQFATLAELPALPVATTRRAQLQAHLECLAVLEHDPGEYVNADEFAVKVFTGGQAGLGGVTLDGTALRFSGDHFVLRSERGEVVDLFVNVGAKVLGVPTWWAALTVPAAPPVADWREGGIR